MTASTITTTPSRVASRSRTPSGAFALFRKDLGEWRHSKRTPVVLIVTALFMMLAAANSGIIAWLRDNVSGVVEASTEAFSLVPMDNLMAGVGSQIFVVAAIFASISLLIAERDSGVLAWIASKPVSRGGIWIAKFASATVVLAVAAALVPLVITVGTVTLMYGAPSIVAVAFLAAGMVAAVAFFVAVVLAASTVIRSQAAVAAIGLAVMLLPPLLAGFFPFEIEPFLPTSIFGWSVGAAAGMDVGFATPIAWAIGLAVIAAIAVRQMDRIEL